jgi:hypothetical protein
MLSRVALCSRVAVGKNGGVTELLPDYGLLILFAIIAAQAAGVAGLPALVPVVLIGVLAWLGFRIVRRRKAELQVT